MDKTMYEAEAEAIGANLGARLKAVVAAEFCKLSEIWAELWSEDERRERKKLLEEGFMELNLNWMEDIVSKEGQMKEEFIVRIEELLEEIHKLEQELSIKIPYNDVQSLPLQCMAKELNQIAQKYRDMVELRMTKLRELRALESSLVEALGAPQFDASMQSVPSEEQLEGLQHHINALEIEKRDRLGIFMEKRQRIVELFNQLGTKPNLLFEKDVVMDFEQRVSPFKVTNENMKLLASLLTRLENAALAAEERRAELVKLLLSLWEYLEQPAQETEAFLESHPGISQNDLNALQGELERCKKEKSQNIGKFVKRIREAIVQQWDKCFVSEATRNELRVMCVTHFNEDVYDLHEIELKRWQNFYAENQRIFELHDKHVALFDKLVELNGRGKSANRYHNRGGQLLLEERQRKIVAKDLPRVEAELRSVLADFLNEHGKPFTHFGVPLVDVLNEKWSNNFDQKTIDKFRDGAASSSTRTPLAVKRPAAATSASTGGKMSRMAAPSSSGLTPRPTARRALNIAKQPEPDSTINLEASYDDFQKTFKSKLGVSKLVSRSTEVLTPRRVLRERTQPVMSSMSSRSSPPVLGAAKTITAITPKTVPRRGRPATQPKTPTRNRLPCIL